MLLLLPPKVFIRRVSVLGRDRDDGGEEGVYSCPRNDETWICVGDFGGAVPQTCGAVQLCVDGWWPSKAMMGAQGTREKESSKGRRHQPIKGHSLIHVRIFRQKGNRQERQ
jgi:hypothetical protein